MSSGPRSGFLVRTFTSVHGLRFALAAWKSGAPDPGTENISYSCFASASPTAFAKPYRNCSYVSGTARPRFAGLCSTGDADRKDEIGSGNTPRNGAGAIATDAAGSPRPARI